MPQTKKPPEKKAPKRRVVLKRRQEHPSPSRRNGCRKQVVLQRRSPTRPSWNPPPPFSGSPCNFPGGFWFGINYQCEIEGPDICGRYLHAKRELQSSGEIDPLPLIFHDGGHRNRRPPLILSEVLFFSVRGGREGEPWKWSHLWSLLRLRRAMKMVPAVVPFALFSGQSMNCSAKSYTFSSTNTVPTETLFSSPNTVPIEALFSSPISGKKKVSR